MRLFAAKSIGEMFLLAHRLGPRYRAVDRPKLASSLLQGNHDDEASLLLALATATLQRPGTVASFSSPFAFEELEKQLVGKWPLMEAAKLGPVNCSTVTNLLQLDAANSKRWPRTRTWLALGPKPWQRQGRQPPP